MSQTISTTKTALLARGNNDSASNKEKQPLPKSQLSQQYGGHHAGGWVDLFPTSWLSRLSPPTAFFMVFAPHLFGAIHAAATHHLPLSSVARVGSYLLSGSFFFSNAAHAWNDLVDAPIDAQIARTKTRPIPRGAISPKAAFLFTCVQAACAAVFLLPLPWDATLAAVATIVGTTYYPFAKRHTHFAQFVLGLCLKWGVMVGSAGMGVPAPWRDPSTATLVAASVVWMVIFDTIYADQDLADDLRVGVKSTAVLFGSWARPILFGLYLTMSALLVASGYWGGICWTWFSRGFWPTGAAIAAGLLVEYGWQQMVGLA
ncbi:UbiA prenyltransferase family-domain-containing protein [Neurospora tetraspora]|uniref:UbiA prenyltransferase family-domain-containing protein n=1 Tax=Neurospora tetraspora TaxID=94610 RepID=A0AAE0JGI5_9PEZI|nr:UbiA prenyltransferase family-domain-containing protein [Neurospora tetraspora]